MKIFSSHADKDKGITANLTDLLRLGTEMPAKDIFCSSRAGMGVPNGQYFAAHILGELNASDLVIALLTPNYMESEFCIAELGASLLRCHCQGKNNSFFSLIAPPFSFKGLGGAAYGVNSGMINKDESLNTLYERIKSFDHPVGNIAHWDQARRDFLADIAAPLSNELSNACNKKFEFLHVENEHNVSDKITFKNKVRIWFGSSFSEPVELTEAVWEAEVGDIQPHNPGWYIFQRQEKLGVAKDEFPTMTLQPGEKFRVSVAIDAKADIDKVAAARTGRTFGAIKFKVRVAGVEGTYKIRVP